MTKITKNVSAMCFHFDEGRELANPATYYNTDCGSGGDNPDFLYLVICKYQHE